MIEIFPAIDVIEGRCVRLTRGDFEDPTVYAENPVEVARCFAKAGFRRLHLVDLDGAKAGGVVNHGVLREICGNVNVSVEFGGGIADDADLRLVFESGAAQAICGSAAVLNPDRFSGWLRSFGAERIILAADARGEEVAISGWRRSAGRKVIDFIGAYAARGVQYVLCTDIERDGMMAGPAVDLYARIRAEFPELKLIASGGVSSLEDIRRLNDLGVYAVVVGKAIYEGRVRLKELAEFKC